MAKVLGIEFGSRRVRLLHADGSAKRPRIRRFETFELRTAEEASSSNFLTKEQQKALERKISQGRYPREPAAMAWSSDFTVFREIDVPFASDDQIRKVLKFEAESHLLNCDIEDVVVSHYALRKERDRSHLMVMAVRKDLLLDRLEALQRAGVDPLFVDLDFMSVFNAVIGLGYGDEHENFMILDCGRRTTNLLLVSNKRLISGRAIRLGVDSVVREVSGDLGADVPQIEAEQRRLLEDGSRGDLVTAGAPEEKQESEKTALELAQGLALDRVEGFYGRLTREVRRTLAVATLPETIEVLYVTGPGSLLPEFAERVAAGLGVEAPVERLSVLERVDSDLDEEQARSFESEGLASLGLAYKLLGRDVTGVDFRQEECRYARKFDQIKEPLLYLCGFLLFLVLLQNLVDVRRLSVKEPFLIKKRSADIARIHTAGVEQFRAALGKDAVLPEKYAEPSKASLNWIRARMQQQVDELKSQLGRGGKIPEMPSALIMWRDCFDAIQKRMDAIGKLFLDDLRIEVRQQRQPYIELSGKVTSLASLDQLRSALNEIPGIEKVERGSSKSVGDLVQFDGVKVVYPEREEYR